MAKLRYNRTFKSGMIGVIFGILLFSFTVVFAIVARVQYGRLVSGMETLEATIVDVDRVHHRKGPNEQEIYITYEVDGKTYSRELKTDTYISYSPGIGTHYKVGDKIDIFYDPQNPEVIASSRSVGVGYFYMAVGVFGLILGSYALIAMLKHRRKFMVTQAEYEKEKEKLKKSKLARKMQKKKLRAERKEKYAKARKIFKVVLIVLAVPVGGFILLLLFGILLRALGYS